MNQTEDEVGVEEEEAMIAIAEIFSSFRCCHLDNVAKRTPYPNMGRLCDLCPRKSSKFQEVSNQRTFRLAMWQ